LGELSLKGQTIKPLVCELILLCVDFTFNAMKIKKSHDQTQLNLKKKVVLWQGHVEFLRLVYFFTIYNPLNTQQPQPCDIAPTLTKV